MIDVIGHCSVAGIQKVHDVDELLISDLLGGSDDFLMIFEFEEIYSLLMESYREFEHTLAELAIDSYLSTHLERLSLDSRRRRITLKVSSLLAQAKAYLDYGNGRSKKLGFQSDFVGATRSAYDGSQAYRICEALRNYAQHQAPPVSGGSSVSRLRGGRLRNGHESVYKPSLKISNLIGTAKAPVKLELEALESNPELMMIIREYIGRISGVHKVVRMRLISYLELHWESHRDKVLGFFEEGVKPFAVEVFYEDDVKRALPLDWDARIKSLQSEYEIHEHLSHFSISTAPNN